MSYPIFSVCCSGKSNWAVKCLRTLAIAIFVLVINSGCAEGQLSDHEYVQLAESYREQGDLRAATIELKNALKQNPENLGARSLLGQIYAEAGNGPGAEKELDRALELGVDRNSVVVPLADAYLLQRAYEKLLRTISPEEGIPDRQRAEVLVRRGKAYQGLNNPVDARNSFQAALAQHSNQVEALVSLSQLALEQSDVEDTKKYLEMAKASAPEKADVLLLQGKYQMRLHEFPQAEQSFRQSLARKPGYVAAHLGIASALLAQNKSNEALKALHPIQAAARQYPNIGYYTGLAEYQRGEFSTAQEHLQNLVSFYPKHTPGLLLSGWALYSLGQLEQAEALAKRVLVQAPNSIPARKLQAAVHLQRRQPELAAEILKLIVPQTSQDRDLLAMLGVASIRAGDQEAAVKVLEQMATSTVEEMSDPAKRALAALEAKNTAGALDILQSVGNESDPLEVRALEIENQLTQKQFSQAINAARRLSDEFPDEPMPFNLLAAAQLGKGDKYAARESLNRALELRPSYALAALNLARLELNEGDAEKARQAYGRVLEHHPGHLFALQQLATLEEREGHSQEARAWLEQAVQHNPEAGEPRIRLAQFYLRTGQPSKTLDEVRELQTQHPNNPALLEVVGHAQLALGQPASAAATFEQLVAVDPASAHAHYLLGKAYAQSNDIEGVRSALGRALELAPEHFLSQLAMVRLLMLEGKVEQANIQLQELKQAHPAHADVLDTEGQLALQQQRPKAAVAVYRAALERFQTGLWAHKLADAQWRAGDHEASLNTLETWLKDHPDDGRARLQLAQANLMLNRLKPARAAFERVVEQIPDNPEALINLAWLIREEKPKQALKHAEHAHGLAPKSPRTMVYLGLILLEQDRNKRALELLKEASVLAPDDPNIGYHLARAQARNGESFLARQNLGALLNRNTSFAKRKDAEALFEELRK